MDGEGNILVVDSANNRIQKFGHFPKIVGSNGSGPLQFFHPAGIMFNVYNNRVYVVDKGNCCVQILNSDLTFSSNFGKEGKSRGHFRKPLGIACDSTGKVYVADSGNHRIQVFTAEGKFLSNFGGHGHDKGKLDTPVGVAVDTNGMVYVSESGNDRISVFTSEDKFATSFACEDEFISIGNYMLLSVTALGNG